jgi:hypothetical protein
MQFDIQFGRLFINDGQSAHLMNDIGLIRAAMSAEQFSLLIRGVDGVRAPTKLMFIPEGMSDEPPALAHITVNKPDFEAAVRQVAQPFIKVMKEIQKILDLDLSKKANREALGAAGAAAKIALAAVRNQISAMTVSASEKEAARVQRQFNVEIHERLKTLGIDNPADIIHKLR